MHIGGVSDQHSVVYIIMLMLILFASVIDAQLSSTQYYVTPDSCNDRQYFDITHLQCVYCINNTIASIDHRACQCRPGYRKLSDIGPTCVSCGYTDATNSSSRVRKAVTVDGLSCVICVNADGIAIDADINTGHCPKCADGPDQFNYQREPDGTLRDNHRCAKCTTGSLPSGSNREHCEPCDHSSINSDCSCTQPGSTRIGGVCFNASSDIANVLPADNPSLYTFTTFADSSIMFASAYAREHLRIAYALCNARRNATACQLIANMCVLNDYSRLSSACILYDQLTTGRISSYETGTMLPLLYYLNTETQVELSRENAIPISYVFNDDDDNSRLDFVFAQYRLNGSFMGMTDDGSILQLCPASQSILNGAYRFGRKYRQKCRLRVSQLWHRDNSPTLIDMYLRFSTNNDDNQQQLFQVPIINQNYREGDLFVNRQSLMNKWKLTRRFFLVDNQLAKDTLNSSSSVLSRVVRYPAYIGIRIELQTTKNGHIMPPYLIIAYNQLSIEAYNDDAEVETIFDISYSMNSFRHDKDIEIVMSVLCSAAVVWAGVCAYSWTRRAGKLMADATTLIKFVLFVVEAVADVFLIVIVSMALWITIGYKAQRVAFYMLLTEDQEWSFVAYLIAATCLKTIAVLHTNIALMLTETFFIDWERSRGHVIPADGESSDAPPTADYHRNRHPNPIVIWRTYLIANEWNELQHYRKTSIALQCFVMLILLKWFNMEALAIAQPGADLGEQPKEYLDTRLTRFAIASGLYLFVAFAQWLINVTIIERAIADHFHNFIDLCSVANISVLSLTHPQFGYYIHGRSVHGHADTNMNEMNQMLQRERDNLCGQRGLESGTELQCFIVNLSNGFREKYESIFNPVRNPNLPTMRLTGTDLMTATMQNVIHAYEEMNQFLSTFIDHGFTNINYTIRDRNMLESILDLEFGDTTQISSFSRDPSEIAYSRTLVYGNEWTHLSFELLIFCLIDLIAHNFILAAAITYMVSTALRLVFRLFYTNNLVKSSLVDARFLI